MKAAIAAVVILLGALPGCAGRTAAGPVPLRPAAAAVEEGHLPGAEGVRLFYRKLGSGRQTLVYLHGGPSSSFRGTGDLMEPLAAGRTLIMYDQRGTGASETVSDPRRLTLTDHLRDLEAVRRHFGINRMSIIGLSWGAAIAAFYAAEQPDRVDGLLLIGPISPTKEMFDARRAKLDRMLGPATVARRAQLRARLRNAGDAEVRAICRELQEISFRFYFARPTREKFEHAALRCELPATVLRNKQVVDDAGLGSLGNWNFRPMLAQIRTPTLVVEGARSEVPLEATRLWADVTPKARFVLIPEAGHEFFMDQPRAWISVAEQFLRENRR